MLNIILDKNSITEDMYIHDVDRYFPYVGIKDNKISRTIIEKLEGGKYLSENSYIDRYGFKINMLDLSTGSKTLILVANTNRVINGCEIGQNAFELLIQSIDGSIYLDDIDRFELPEYFNLSEVLVDGKQSSTVLELENKLWKE